MRLEERTRALQIAVDAGHVTEADFLEATILLLEAVVANTESTLRLCDKLAELELKPRERLTRRAPQLRHERERV